MARERLNGFDNQSAAERLNTYVSDVHGKKRAHLDLDRGAAMIEITMNAIIQNAEG